MLLELLHSPADQEHRELAGAADRPAALPVDAPAACYDYEDFFRRTRALYPEDVLSHGRVRKFHEEMVLRHVEKVLVRENGYEVQMKAGVTISVAAAVHTAAKDPLI